MTELFSILIKTTRISNLIILSIVFVLFWLFQKAETFNQFCRNEIEAIDDDQRESLILSLHGNITAYCKLQLENFIVDPMARQILAESITLPMRESIVSNHFTKRLKKENYAGFKQRMINKIESSYCITCSFCSADDSTKLRSESSLMLESIFTYWLQDLTEIVATHCEQKIDVYNRYLPNFKFSRHFKTLITNCRTKNTVYIQELRLLNKKLKQGQAEL